MTFLMIAALVVLLRLTEAASGSGGGGGGQKQLSPEYKHFYEFPLPIPPIATPVT